jgi:hypothetical protein
MTSRYASRRYFSRRSEAPAFSLAQLVVLAAGVVWLAFGILAIARAGLSGPLDQPLVNVFGYQQTALLGILETAAGALLILSALGSVGARVAMLLGIGLVVVGVLFLGDLSWFHAHLSPESSFGWVPIISGGAVAASLMLLP